MMKAAFVFNGRSSLDFSIVIEGSDTFNNPERDVETVSVDGRNGDLIIDHGRWKNVDLSYHAYIKEDFDLNFSNFRNFMLQDSNYHVLKDNFHPDEFRMARFKDKLDPDVTMLRAGVFSIKFNCKPQRFLLSGESEYTLSAGTYILRNPTINTSKPVITVTSGTGKIQVNNTIIQLKANNGQTIIDSDTEDCYEGSTNRNSDLILETDEYPSLKAGNNSIVIPSGMTVGIKPRWFKL